MTKPNDPKPPKPTELTIDGKTYLLRYNFNDLVDAEPVTNCNLLDALGRASQDLTATQLRGLFYAMTAVPDDAPKREGEVDQQALLEYFGKLLRLDTIGQVRAAITEAMVRAVSDEQGDLLRDSLRDTLTKALQEVPAVEQATGDAVAA